MRDRKAGPRGLVPSPGKFIPPIAGKTGKPCKLCVKLGRLCGPHNPAIAPPDQRKFTDDQIRDALIKSKGMVATAARLLKTRRETVHRYIRKSPDLQEVVGLQRDGVVDEAELGLEEAIQAREPWAIKFALQTIGKSRGYSDRTEITGADGGPLVTSALPDGWDALSDETKRIILNELEEREKVEKAS